MKKKLASSRMRPHCGASFFAKHLTSSIVSIVGAASLCTAQAHAQTHAQTRGQEQTAEQDAQKEDEILVPPELLSAVDPLYPEDALREGINGEVTMEIDIDAEGAVSAVSVVTSPDPRLAKAAMGAATNMEFAPATVAGKPIAVRIVYTLTFTIDEQAREALLSEEEAQRLIDEANTKQQRELAPINLRGRIFVAGERQVIAGATITVEDTNLTTETDENGVFILHGVPSGAQKVVVESSGYEAFISTENIKSNVVTELKVYLVPRQTAGLETVVRERRAKREVSERVLTQKELTRVPGTFGDAIRAVQRLPGVSRAPFGLGAVLVRGGAPEDTAILIDGHLTRILFHLGAGPSVINSDLVKQLEFYPGGFGARFGRAIAGAIDVVTRDPKSEQWSGRANIDLLQTGFRLEGPMLGGSFFFAGRRSYAAEVLNIGDTIVKVANLNISSFTLAPRYQDYQLKTTWKMGAGQTFSLNVFGSDDDLDFALDAASLNPAAPSSAGISVGFHRVNPVWKFTSPQRNENGQPLVKAFISPMAERSYSENRFDASQFRLDADRFGLRAEAEFRLWPQLGITIGTDDIYSVFTAGTDLPFLVPDERLFPRPVVSDAPRFIIDDTVYGANYAFYTEADLTLGNLLIIGGLRADFWTYYDEIRTSIDPRLTVHYQMLDSVSLKGSLGVYHQSATPFELSKDFGNPALPLESGWQASLGAEVALTNSLDVDWQIFYRGTDDLAELVINPGALNTSGEERIQPVGEGRAYGSEVLLRQRLDKGFFGWIAYTLLRAEEKENTDEPWILNPFDQTHILSIAASYQLPYGFELGGAVRYVTGSPTTLAIGGNFDGDTGRYLRVNGQRRGGRVPPFFQMDARVDKKFIFDTWSLALFLDLQNATNNQNFEFFQYNYNFSEIQGFPGLPILPVFGAEASF